ncbi:MAG: helix-turn-helix domain-containing protein [Chitinophaga rupis]
MTGSNTSLKQLAAKFGFTDESHLSNAFKAHFQLTPTEYRRKNSSL